MAFNPKTEYTIVQDQFAIEDFHKYKEDYITRPAYQRKNVWSTKKKQALLDSLFRRYYVPKLVIREVRLSNDQTVKEIIDGQQRITTVQEFFANELRLPKTLNDISPELSGKYYNDLSTEVRKFIDKEVKYHADIIKNIDDPHNVHHQIIATDIFWRLQQGESLNYMEIAHAQLSSLSRNIIVKYSDDITFDFDEYEPVDHNPNKHNLFNILNVDNSRMKHLQYMARFLMIERSNGYTELKDSSVEEFIETYKRDNGIGNYSLENEDYVKKTLGTLNVFYEIFKDDPAIDDNSGVRELSVEYFILSFYILIRYLNTYYVMDDQIKSSVRDFMYAFHERWKTADESDTDILTFSNNRQQSSSNMEARDRVLRQLFFEYLTENNIEIKTKDENRAFNEAQRIKIYRRDKGLCQECLNEGKPEKEAVVSWSQYQADHIIPHSKGGETIIENAQVLCRYHNQSKGAAVPDRQSAN